MSLEIPTGNIKLTTEQLLSLEEYQIRLSNLQTEISIHEKNIRGKKIEISNLEKNREYQKGLLDSLILEVNNLSNKKLELLKYIEESENRLKSIQDESAVVSEEIISQKSDLNDKTSKLNTTISLYEQKELGLSQSIQNHEKEKNILAQKKSILSEAISKI